ncbi:hypothetical protein WDW86_08295 [Bdellovibrionota bacterium FG-2]
MTEMSIELDPITALENHAIDGLVATLYQNERPLFGLAGLLDWRFHGALSSYLRAGAMSGREGECIYIPFEKHGQVTHLIFLGCGSTKSSGTRSVPSPASLEILRKNLVSLALPKIGISKADFGNPSEPLLKGVPLWACH